jgi:hypothetical protein
MNRPVTERRQRLSDSLALPGNPRFQCSSPASQVVRTDDWLRETLVGRASLTNQLSIAINLSPIARRKDTKELMATRYAIVFNGAQSSQ